MKVLYMYTAIFYFFIIICFCINKLKAFEEWSSESKYIPWSILLFTCIVLSWISYPTFLNQVIVKKDNIVEINLQKEVGGSELNQIVNSNNLVKDSEENFSYKKLGEGYGTLGDTYGALNTLFTGLAFGGLIVSIFLQMLELRATRKELAEQKDALIGQKDEFSKQTRILENQQIIIDNQFKETKKQNFLKQFYALLQERNNLLNNLVMPKDEKELRGNGVLAEYAIHFRQIRKDFDPEKHDRDFFNTKWDTFSKSIYNSYDYQVRSYLKFYKLLFTFVDKSEVISDFEKKYYKYMLKDFVGVEEQLILMWLGSFDNNFNKMCVKYSLLSGIYNNQLEKVGLAFFDLNAFGDSKKWKESFKNSVDLSELE